MGEEGWVGMGKGVEGRGKYIMPPPIITMFLWSEDMMEAR